MAENRNRAYKKRCPGTLFTDCNHGVVKPGETLCAKCTRELEEFRDKMLRIDDMRKEFVGKAVIIAKMAKSGLVGQTSPKYPFVMPRRDGLWVKQLNSQGHLGYLRITLTASNEISALDVFFFCCCNDGSAHLDVVSLSDSDRAVISKLCKSILKSP